MSDPVVTLSPEQVSVPANGQVGATVTVRNVSGVVEGYRLELLAQEPTDGPAVWGEVQPPEVRVYPNEQASATVVFAPPAGALAPSGRFAFGVRVTSVVDPEASSVVEGDVEVGQVLGLQAKLVPVTSSGRWRGRHVVRFTNWGNTSTHLHVTVSDPDDRLGFLPAEADLDLPLGGTADLKLRVRARKPFLRGTPVRLPFQVVGEPVSAMPRSGGARPPLPGDPGRPVVDGAMTQKPILTRATVAVAVLALAAAVGAGAYVWKKPHALKTYETEGTPPTPAAKATARPDGTIEVTWGAVPQVEKYKLLSLQNGAVTAVTDIPAEQEAYLSPALMPATEYCFQVESVRGKFVSAASPQSCATTAAPPTPSPSATSSGAATTPPAGPAGPGGATSPGGASSSGGVVPPGGGVVPAPVGSAIPTAKPDSAPTYGTKLYAQRLFQAPGEADDPVAYNAAYTVYNTLTLKGIPVFIVHTTWYPDMTLGSNAVVAKAWLVMSGPLEYQFALTFCTTYEQTGCVLLRPGS